MSPPDVEWVFCWFDDDHDQVAERLAVQAVQDGIDPAYALTLGAREYEILRDERKAS